MTAKKTSKPTKTTPAAAPVDTASKVVVEDYADKPAATKLERTLDRAAETTPKTTPAVATKSKSTIQSPVKVVWAVCEEMKSSARKDVVAECMRRGVNVHTAKTQFQRWSASKKATST